MPTALHWHLWWGTRASLPALCLCLRSLLRPEPDRFWAASALGLLGDGWELSIKQVLPLLFQGTDDLGLICKAFYPGSLPNLVFELLSKTLKCQAWGGAAATTTSGPPPGSLVFTQHPPRQRRSATCAALVSVAQFSSLCFSFGAHNT